MHVFLTTARLLLRRFTATDAALLADLNSDPAVMRYLTGGRPTPRSVVEREELPRLLGYYDRFAGLGLWAAVLRSSGEFLGWFELRPVEGRHAELELGYRLRSAVWGQGYATEGSLALIDKGFAEYGADRVVATTMAVNAASRRVMEKCGLRLMREFHEDWPELIDGSEYGDVEYALTRDEWAVGARTRAADR